MARRGQKGSPRAQVRAAVTMLQRQLPQLGLTDVEFAEALNATVTLDALVSPNPIADLYGHLGAAVDLWVEQHGVPETQATSDNEFVHDAERVFWRVVKMRGLMPVEQ